MCMIVDANCAPLTFSSHPDEDFLPIYEALTKKGATLVLGGTKLRNEYRLLAAVSRIVAVLDQAGRVRQIADAPVDAQEKLLRDADVCLSDDEHVVALAQISGARLLCSKDQALHADFGEKGLIDAPRGKVYQTKAHAPLIRQCCIRK